MKYNTKKWLEAVADLMATEPFAMKELPEELRLSNEHNPLVKSGHLIHVGKKWIKGTRYYANVWRISPKFVESRKQKLSCKQGRCHKSISVPIFDIEEEGSRFGLNNMLLFRRYKNTPHISLSSHLQSCKLTISISTHIHDVLDGVVE